MWSSQCLEEQADLNPIRRDWMRSPWGDKCEPKGLLGIESYMYQDQSIGRGMGTNTRRRWLGRRMENQTQAKEDEFHEGRGCCCCCLATKLCPTLLQSHGLYIACQAPLSVGFSRQEYWSGLPFLSLGDLPDPGIEPVSPSLTDRFFTTEPPEKLKGKSKQP